VSTFDNSLKQSEAVTKLSNEKVKTELDWDFNLEIFSGRTALSRTLQYI